MAGQSVWTQPGPRSYRTCKRSEIIAKLHPEEICRMPTVCAERHVKARQPIGRIKLSVFVKDWETFVLRQKYLSDVT